MMQRRDLFGNVAARGFSITLGLKEGYENGKIHTLAEVLLAIEDFARKEACEIGGSLKEETIFYSYRAKGDMVWTTEPGVVISGLFPPNKFDEKTDGELVDLIGKMVEYLADATGQVSVHAEICNQHHCWKRIGQQTARERAQS